MVHPVVDVKTAIPRRVFLAAEGTGSVFHAVVATRQISWADGNRLVFPWERTGWRHLYSVPDSVPAMGGTPLELTPGEGDVEEVSLSGDRKTVYFNANIGDIDGRHLWSVAVAGGPAKQLTTGERIDWAPTPLSAEASLFFLSSSFNRKAHPMLRIHDREQNLPSPAIAIPRWLFFMLDRAVRCCWASTTCITTRTPTP